jgi:hypothetical protein
MLARSCIEGPDRGVPKEGALPPGKVSYARSLPRAKALQREVLIAYQMNGRGHPSRQRHTLCTPGSRELFRKQLVERSRTSASFHPAAVAPVFRPHNPNTRNLMFAQ